MKKAKTDHMKKAHEALVKAGYKKTHASKMLTAAKKKAKDEGFKKQTAMDKKHERAGEKKVTKKYHQTAKDRMKEKKAFIIMLEKKKKK